MCARAGLELQPELHDEEPGSAFYLFLSCLTSPSSSINSSLIACWPFFSSSHLAECDSFCIWSQLPPFAQRHSSFSVPIPRSQGRILIGLACIRCPPLDRSTAVGGGAIYQHGGSFCNHVNVSRKRHSQK